MSGVAWATADAYPTLTIVAYVIGGVGILIIMAALVVSDSLLTLFTFLGGAVLLIVGVVLLWISTSHHPEVETNAESLRDGYGISRADARALVATGSGREVVVTLDDREQLVTLRLSADHDHAYLVVNDKIVPASENR